MDALFEKVAGLQDCEVVSDTVLLADHLCSTEELYSHLKAVRILPKGGAAFQLMAAEVSGTNVHWCDNGAPSAWLSKHLNAV